VAVEELGTMDREPVETRRPARERPEGERLKVVGKKSSKTRRKGREENDDAESPEMDSEMAEITAQVRYLQLYASGLMYAMC